MARPRKQGGPMIWTGQDAGASGAPSGYTPVVMPAYSMATTVADLHRHIRNLYNCNLWHRCLNADKVDGKDASDLQLTVAGGAAIDSPNLVEGSAIDITTSSSDITIAIDINELTSATVANGDEVAIADVDDSNSIKKVTALSIAQLATGGDVSGPGASTDNAVARWDGTGGQTLQNSGITIDDSDNITGVESIDPNTIELGGEAGNTDTTITRSAAGVVAVEGVDLLRADQNLSDVDDYSAALTNLGHKRDVQTADAGISSTTMTATELNVSIAGSKRHLIRATFFIDSTSSAGFKIDFGGGTIGLDDMKLLYTISDSSSGDVVDTGRVTSLTGVIQPSSNITGQYEIRVSGVIATNADADPGTLIVRHARAGFGGTSTFQENSELEVIEV